ncbi:MAG TPA: hypothetical protein VEL31_15450 [Ktedonobacteraceae bacterium]|nr:hypothetical protein [Ktedonobacteraceae bacterium]
MLFTTFEAFTPDGKRFFQASRSRVSPFSEKFHPSVQNWSALRLIYQLWAYREWLGVSLVGLVVLAVLVSLRGRVNEQNLRRVRCRHHEELPLDGQGEPYYWPQDAQENPYHSALRASSRQSSPRWSDNYRQQERY